MTPSNRPGLSEVLLFEAGWFHNKTTSSSIIRYFTSAVNVVVVFNNISTDFVGYYCKTFSNQKDTKHTIHQQLWNKYYLYFNNNCRNVLLQFIFKSLNDNK